MELALHKTMMKKTSDKTLKLILALALGLSGAFSVDRWPNHAALFEMILYTAMIFFPLLFFFWSDRHRARFWTGITLIVVLHGVLLFLMRSSFPFRAILLVLPVLFIEGCALAIIMIKLLGDDSSSVPNR